MRFSICYRERAQIVSIIIIKINTLSVFCIVAIRFELDRDLSVSQSSTNKQLPVNRMYALKPYPLRSIDRTGYSGSVSIKIKINVHGQDFLQLIRGW